MSPLVFHILGTDTDVGKTYLTGLCLKWCSLKGIRAISVKSVHSGWPKDAEWGEDLEAHRENWALDLDPEIACAYRFDAPMSPHYASYIEDRQIELETLKTWYENLSKIDVNVIFVEGIGGVCCPISPQKTYLDFLKLCPAPAILVGRVGLGALNHAIMSESMLLNSGLSAESFILNEEKNFEKDDIIHDSAVWELERQLKAPVLGPLKREADDENLEKLDSFFESLFKR